jgi:YHS domain-containing protein
MITSPLTLNIAVVARRSLLLGAAAAILAVGSATAAFAGEVNEVGGLAIKGHDPVAYFTQSRPIPGQAQFTAAYKGATFRFASAQNRDLFQANPEAYAPQYGGFCAYATANGYKADIDPAAFKLVSGKLYLNYNADIQGYIAKADQNWPKVSTLTEVLR